MIIVVMGVTGAGKTTVGKLLAKRLNWKFLDADDLHPPANIEKMKRGISLTDADREPGGKCTRDAPQIESERRRQEINRNEPARRFSTNCDHKR
jgi:carbohydrate kinase (thermoresistant glucokinase family)